MSFNLPVALGFGGESWAIRWDYRQVLIILAAFEDPELSEAEKLYVCLHNLYVDFGRMPPELYPQACEAAVAFIDCGEKGGAGPRTMDWEQDAPLIFAAVNRAAGREVRGAEPMHWWTFLGYFMEIRGSVFATVLSLRQKKARHKKLEKHEQEFWNGNLEICRLKRRMTGAERAELARLERLLEGNDRQ